MSYHGNTSVLVHHGVPWYTMVYHGVPRYAYHGTPWYTIVDHGKPWYIIPHGITMVKPCGIPRGITTWSYHGTTTW